METKKNPRADVRRNSSIYFAVGLVLMLLAANYSINYKTYDKEAINIAMLSMGDLDEVVIPITEHQKTPPPVIPQPVIPEDFDIKEDDEPIIEDIVDTTEDSPDEPIIEVKDIVVETPDEDIVVPIHVIQHVPEFPGCEDGNNDEKRACMSAKISKHVQKKFNVDLAETLGLTGKQRISVVFKIDKTGSIVGVQSRAPHPRLEKEAARVINLLPKMKPGKKQGKEVTVSYSLPIIFQVEN